MLPNKKTLISALFLGLLAGGPAQAVEVYDLPLMPYPASVDQSEGELVIQSGFALSLAGSGAEALPEAVLTRFEQRLKQQTGMNVTRKAPADTEHHHHSTGHSMEHSGQATPLLIHIEDSVPRFRQSDNLQPYTDGYQIHVLDDSIHIQATTQLGAGHALETLLQLLGLNDSGEITLSVMCVDDQPRFGWRGLMLDTVRHFFSVDTIKRQLDGMAAAKLNIFHWHLTDDQGWRLESRAYPKLHEDASGGQYYTWEQVREIVNYAADRGIQVMPEIDMPGHSSAIAVAYPELMSAPGPYEPEDRWGVHNPLLNPANDEVYRFAHAILKEVADLFPFDYIHIGGDEVDPQHWETNPDIQAFMERMKLADAHDLHAYFNQRLSAILTSLDRKMMGWDEVLHPALPTSTAVQSWQGPDALGEAADAGHPAILSTGFYLDQPQPAGYHYRNRIVPEPLDFDTNIADGETWQTWAFEMPRKRGSAIKGTFTLIESPGNQRRGFMDFAGKSRQKLHDLALTGDRIRFTLDTWMGPVEARLVRRDETLTGDMIVGNAPYTTHGELTARSGNNSALPTEQRTRPTLSDKAKSHILGGEIALWAELIDEQSLDTRLWPRGFVVAERLWLPDERRDTDNLYQRLPAVSQWAAESVGLQHFTQADAAREKLLPEAQQPLAEVLADTLEQAQYYHRHHEKSANETYSRRDPLNRFVDTLPAESMAARDFSRRMDQWIANPGDQAVAQTIRESLEHWRQATKQLLTQLNDGTDPANLKANTQRVLTTAEWGLVLAEHWQQHRGLSPSLRRAAHSALRNAQHIQDEMVVAIAYPVERLLNAVPAPAITTDWMPDDSFTTGIEGPAMGPNGALYAVNFQRQGTIGKVTAQDSGTVFTELPEGSIGNSIRFDQQGNLWIADYTGHNVLQLDQASGEVIATHHNSDMHQPNDIVLRSDGTVFASDPNWADSTGQLWRLNPEGAFTLLEADMGTTNGIELSPDETVLYVNESVQRNVWAYDVADNGDISNKRLFYRFDDFGMDGMAVDPEGNLYIARYGAGVIAVLSPAGRMVEQIPLTGRYPTNIALDFSGDNASAYVTLQQRGAVEVFELSKTIAQ
ncbi:family 20 glycosylhydrolase [Marinimicrobium sp. ARAG 43.8]|uniref:family 20 glycosylhydrolase n=1 Tax=Marinimicrobium sp. ARAG 43.8 TaxID=3418719 RepID=UPI003CED7AB5